MFRKLLNDAHEARCRTMQRRPIHNNEFLAFDEYTLASVSEHSVSEDTSLNEV